MTTMAKLVMSRQQGNAPWRTQGGAFLLGKRNTVLIATLTERGVARFLIASGKVDARIGKWGQFRPIL